MNRKITTGLSLFFATAILLFGTNIKAFADNSEEKNLKDGKYSIEVELTGGSGKASINSPTLLYVKGEEFSAEILWSSSNYDYMIVDGERYDNVAAQGEFSKFIIPITIDEKMDVIADTTAMGHPIEINYQLDFDRDSIGSTNEIPQEAAKEVIKIAIVIIVVGGILDFLLKRKRRG